MPALHVLFQLEPALGSQHFRRRRGSNEIFGVHNGIHAGTVTNVPRRCISLGFPYLEMVNL